MAIVQLRVRPPIPITTEFIATGAVTTDRLADNAVTTVKLADNAVTLSKVGHAVRSGFFLGDDTEVFSTSTTFEEIKNFSFIKSNSIEAGGKGKNWIHLFYRAELATQSTGVTVTLGVFIDNEPTPRATNTTTVVYPSFDIVDGDFSIADLSLGKHIVRIKVMTASSAVRVFQRTLEIILTEQ